ncbi:MAG: hypothetical protein VX083_15800 [Pseudomonadota bacterium]|uniref:hypothetical protein n=1 Tax=Thalassovita sp. TaxID=1979401 RepID=UPI002AB18035|nr:hypothetical protein [Thalassovita sp.]MEC7961692.1 hypothetical protein [Pseudomonadota bacterium]MEC8040454.1 hypothetical protein [Pseudomonadota bacterium]MEC8294956.1 hypothetical protein [Pseudomonadota bacterium]
MATPAQHLKDFEDLLEKCQQAARDGDVAAFQGLDHQLRNLAMVMVGALPASEPGDTRMLEALRDAVRQLSTTADQIDVDRRKLKTRQQTDRKVRLAYSRNTGRL